MTQKLPIDDFVAQTLYSALKLEHVFTRLDAEIIKNTFVHSGLYLYPAGSIVLKEGESGRDLYIVCKGKLDVSRKDSDGVRSVGTLQEGDIFGEMGLLGSGVRSATVTAAQDSEIFRLHHHDTDSLLTLNRKLGSHLQRLISERFPPANPNE